MTDSAVHVSVRLHPDGWVHVYVDTDDLPSRYTHGGFSVPKLAVFVNGDDPDYLGPDGDWQPTKPTA